MAKLNRLPDRVTTMAPRLQLAGLDRDQRRSEVAPWRAWYNTARWRRLRLRILKRDQWTCQQTHVVLVEGRTAWNSAVVDHKRPHHGDPALFWAEDNLQAVTKEWHDGAKQRLERGAP